MTRGNNPPQGGAEAMAHRPGSRLPHPAKPPKPPEPPVGGAEAALVVPVEVQALVVTGPQQAARRWRYNYAALGSFDSPEPWAGGGESTTGARVPGVYLHWSLPDALRHGTGAGSGPVAYPRVPNRWLVVRLSGSGANRRTATGWVVESDCPNDDSPTMYLVDQAVLDAWVASRDDVRIKGARDVRQRAADNNGTPVALLGQAFPLAGGWRERAATATFLTAVAPGNVLFSQYEPHCANVFTLYDAMTGLADTDTVSYLVVGWCSNPADEVLATSTAAALGWSVTGSPTTTPASCLYQGLALGVPWKRNATTAPPSPLPALAGKVHVGVGNTTVDAFTALVAGQLQDPAAVDLLLAFQYGLLPQLEAVNGPDLLATAVHQASFGSQPGGLRWEIVAATDRDDPAPAALTPAEAAWLLALNRAQAALDDARATLDAHRWALYALWWKWQKGLAESVIDPPDGFDPTAHGHAVKVTLPAQLATDAQAVGALLPAVPQPVVQPGDTPQESFERGIARFATARGLGAGKVLKAVTGDRWWRSGDPVVVLSGIEPAPLPDPADRLPCRLTTGLVSSLRVGSTTVDAGRVSSVTPTLPGAGTGALPAAVPALLLEAFLLDPASAAAIAGATGLTTAAVSTAISNHAPAAYPGQVLPAVGLGPWEQQPWKPLLMEWQVGYVPIPAVTGTTPNWTFDGRDQRYTGPFGPFAADPAAPMRVLGGISPLTPEAQFTFRAQLRRFIATYAPGASGSPPDLAALARLQQAIDDADSWRFMSQALTGFGDLVARRDTRAQTGPDATVATAVAGRTAGVPDVPDGPSHPFDAVRQGQFAVQTLLVYDTFGQALTVVGGTGPGDPQGFVPALDAAVRPDRPVITRNPARLVELRPRLQQPSRLEVTWVDATDDSHEVVPGSSASPVAAWLLPNHLDDGLLLYGADGRGLGEVRLAVDAAGTRTARWQPPPHSTLTLPEVAAAAPHLAAMITDPGFTDPTAFRTFLDTVDTTLWSIDPRGNRADQNLSVLIGRPLALARAGLRLRVGGAPVADLSDWAVTWPPPPPEFLTRPVGVRLGDLASRQDGLVGFYTGHDYSRFNSVAAPDPATTQGFVRVIGPVGAPTGGNWLDLRYGDTAPTYVSLVMDPQAAVHAVTGLLPTTATTLPDPFVRRALARLELTFRVGSLLTHAEPTPSDGDTAPGFPQSQWLPQPTERNGTWSWWERAGAAEWSSYGLLRATADARLKDYPSTLRDGFLQLIADLEGE